METDDERTLVTGVTAIESLDNTMTAAKIRSKKKKGKKSMVSLFLYSKEFKIIKFTKIGSSNLECLFGSLSGRLLKLGNPYTLQVLT